MCADVTLVTSCAAASLSDFHLDKLRPTVVIFTSATDRPPILLRSHLFYHWQQACPFRMGRKKKPKKETSQALEGHLGALIALY